MEFQFSAVEGKGKAEFHPTRTQKWKRSNSTPTGLQVCSERARDGPFEDEEIYTKRFSREKARRSFYSETHRERSHFEDSSRPLEAWGWKSRSGTGVFAVQGWEQSRKAEITTCTSDRWSLKWAVTASSRYLNG